MNLIKMRFLSGTIAPPKSRKHVPTLIWIREKHGRRLIKIEDTYQEEVLQEGGSSQEAMVLQLVMKLHKRYSRQWKSKSMFSKRWGIRLTKLEEAKLKKGAHVEIIDDEEGEGWDEKDKANYERNKQFEKLTTDTSAMREKMEKMQLAFHKA